MLDPVLRSRLRDPAYFMLHLKAISTIREVGALGWYDSQFLRRVKVAQRYLAEVRPDTLSDFNDGLTALTPRAGFREVLIDDVFDAATHEEIIDIASTVQPGKTTREDTEQAAFGRDVVWDTPRFLELQEKMRPLVAELVGRPLVSSYNFLSRYGAQGKCDLHMDAPCAMFTFDYCIAQDAVWPIYVSRPVDWIGSEVPARVDPEQIICDSTLDFNEQLLRPNQALLFNGTSQWHYRRPKMAGGFCNLLFFHYYPEDCEDLVVPARWAAHFGIPELEPLCDLFAHPEQDGLA